MLSSSRKRLPVWTRALCWILVLWLGLTAVGSVHADVPTRPPGIEAAPEESAGNFWRELVSSIFNSKRLMETLQKPQYQVLAFIAINLIVFVETGLLIGFFLPGDSLLVTAGVVAAGGGWNLPLLLLTVTLSAIVGDSLGYSIGYNTGPKIFNREQSWFFNKDHLLNAQEFYERHGGKTIILARFVPIIRTFAPVVAGVGRMDYRRFLFFNIFGGIGWVFSMILTGYYLVRVLRDWLGIDVEAHIEKVVIVVVLLSISPGIYMWLKKKLSPKVQAEPEPEPALTK
jgi:membrane-associated protein